MKTAAVQLPFKGALRPYNRLLATRGGAADEARRQRTIMRLDFVSGTFSVDAPSGAPTPQTVPLRPKAAATQSPQPEVTARLELQAGRVRVNLRVAGREALNFDAAAQQSSDDEGITLGELLEAAQGRRAPPRASARAAATAW